MHNDYGGICLANSSKLLIEKRLMLVVEYIAEVYSEPSQTS